MYLLSPGKHFEDIKPDESMLFFPEKRTADWFYSSGIPERDLIEWARDTLVSPDKMFIDIGAHVGTYSLVCGRIASHTHAFECNPRVFCYLAANIALHELHYKITPHACALGHETKSIPYYIRSEDGGGNGVKVLTEQDAQRNTLVVDMRTLDSFHFENVGCIKIDVEGFEKEVLMGGLDTIRRCKPTILFESWSHRKDLQDELFAYIESIGYRITKLMNTQDMFLAVGI